MKLFCILLIAVMLVSCHKDQVESQEVKASIIDFTVGYTACSGGYAIQIESKLYRSFTLPAPYDDYRKFTFPASVWVRYKSKTGSCSDVPGLIEVTTIRGQ